MRAGTQVFLVGWAIAVGVGLSQSISNAQTPRLVSQSEYEDRLKGFWLGQCIANWTGLRTEGARQTAPFLTDADWRPPFNGPYPLDWVTWGNPWSADDDTDIEYVYLHAMNQAGHTRLSSEEIRDAWMAHIVDHIWVSNASARALMARGVFPPTTGMGEANRNRLMIDAQLTTEFFGLFAPGMPGRALTLADLPIRTTSGGYASHASQFYMLLHTFALQAPAGLSPRERNLWLVQEARGFIPDSSKAADVIDFCVNDFPENPDINDWERTRDRVFDRYQLNASANGFVYRAWYESSVNLADGVIALLYGDGDYRRTVQIGTLSGWDSDNGTATMGGLIGFLLGYNGVVAQFPERTLFESYRWSTTRTALPDYVPGAGTAEDTFSLMAARMVPLVEHEIENAGGLADSRNRLWLLPPIDPTPQLEQSPTQRTQSASGNNFVRSQSGGVTASTSIPGSPTANRGVGTPIVFANGLEHSFSGIEELDSDRNYFSSYPAAPLSQEIVLTVAYDRSVDALGIRFIEGDFFTDSWMHGGWFQSITFEARVNGSWTSLPGQFSVPLDSELPFQTIDFMFDPPEIPISITGVRIRGLPGGNHRFVTCSELDAVLPVSIPPSPTFDLNADGVLNPDDLSHWHNSPTDLDGDGQATESDRIYLTRALRWRERDSLSAPN